MDTTMTTTEMRAQADEIGLELTVRDAYPNDLIMAGTPVNNLLQQRNFLRSATEPQCRDLLRRLTDAKDKSDRRQAEQAATEPETDPVLVALQERLARERTEELQRLEDYRASPAGQREATIELLQKIYDVLATRQ